MRLKDNESGLLNAFALFDINHDGFIDITYLKENLVSQGEPLDENEWIEQNKRLKKNSDGKIDYRDFCSTVYSSKS